jgi:hypothetical protein
VRLVEPELDTLEERLSEQGVRVVSGIARARYPDDMADHVAQIRATVSSHRTIGAWLVVNEADLNWQEGPSKYADYFIKTSGAIKQECPSCVVVLSLAGGVIDGVLRPNGLDFFEAALANGVGPYFDVLDVHFQGQADDYVDLAVMIAAYREAMQGHELPDKPIWLTELGTYDGDPLEICPIDKPDCILHPTPFQSERQQASGLIKRYVYGLSLGIERMFWTTIIEWGEYGGTNDGYFSHVGLINNPDGADKVSHKKLAYYWYKKMVALLAGSAWDDVRILQDAGGLHVYELHKSAKKVWVAWQDGALGAQATIDGVAAGQVRVTEGVASYESGADVRDFDSAFLVETWAVPGGRGRCRSRTRRYSWRSCKDSPAHRRSALAQGTVPGLTVRRSTAATPIDQRRRRGPRAGRGRETTSMSAPVWAMAFGAIVRRWPRLASCSFSWAPRAAARPTSGPCSARSWGSGSSGSSPSSSRPRAALS